MSGLAAAQSVRSRASQSSPAAPTKTAQAYEQFLLGHHLEENDDVPGAIAAFNRAIEDNPSSAEIRAELAGVFLRHEQASDAAAAAEQALKIAPDNAEAHRVLGLVYAAEIEGRERRPAAKGGSPDPAVASAIAHLEQATAQPAGEGDPVTRATLARLYLRAASYDKAIALLVDLVRHQPGWQEGPLLLAQAYAAAGRTNEAIEWLSSQAADDPDLLPTLAEFYERSQRWKDAAGTYARALELAPRSSDLQVRYAQALLNAGTRDDISRARDVLTDVVSVRLSDARASYLLSQADRRFGDLDGAEAAARRVITLQDAGPWGYYALAEALEARRQYAGVVSALTPAIEKFHTLPGDHTLELSMLLPHLGFAHQELGHVDLSLASFEEAHRLSPKDPNVAGYLIDANITAKKYAAAIELAQQARMDSPGDLRLVRLEARALLQDGKPDQGIALLEDALKTHPDEPVAYLALAHVYADASRGPQAVKLLQDAEARFPDNTSIAFELGAVLDKQKKFAEAETAFQRVLASDPENAAALNYLGYMLAERGERLDESVGYLKKALQAEPENGSFLDSLGWAYFKAGKLDLAEENLRRAADQLKANSVVQDHYGDLLYKLSRFDDAIAAWDRALAGDGDTISPADIDKKIRGARQKINRR
jgi:tetratricopeptide (TPR) repeat protein